jgi:hypothetical protein
VTDYAAGVVVQLPPAPTDADELRGTRSTAPSGSTTSATRSRCSFWTPSSRSSGPT